jgi:hypothetical protein
LLGNPTSDKINLEAFPKMGLKKQVTITPGKISGQIPGRGESGKRITKPTRLR